MGLLNVVNNVKDKALNFDPTPGFNINSSAGGGVPFVSKGNGSTGQAPAARDPYSLLLPDAGTGAGGIQANDQGSYQQNQTIAANQARAQAAADAQERAATLFGIDSQLASANDGLGRLDSRLNTGIGNINRDYEAAYSRLMGQRKVARDEYDRGTSDQLNEYQAARNQGATAARSFLDNARRTLGSQGAGGGSAARYGIPYQAQQQAAASNAQAQSTNNRNIGALTTNWNRADADFNNSVGGVQRQRDQGIRDYSSKIEDQRAQLLANIGSLSGQRNIANGGDFRAAQAAANPYTSRIAGILDNIDSLAATPAIREEQVVVGRPDLSGYDFATPDAPVAAIQDPSLAGNVIYGDEEQQQNPLLSLFGLDDQYQYV